MKSPSLMIKTPLLLISVVLFSPDVFAQANPVPARVTQAVDMRNLVTLRGNVHPLARLEFDQGVAPDDLPMERMLLVLQRGPEQEAALRQLLDDQQVKSSPRFHQWLTPEQFGQQFGPADSDVQAVTDWLASQGFLVTKVAAGRTVIEFSGTAGLVRQVLGTEIHKFTVNGKEQWANANDPQIPAALAPVVAGFASLNNFPRQSKPVVNAYSHSQATGETHALFTVSGNGTNYYAVAPWDFVTIYNVLPLWNANIDGRGQTIAVVSDSNIHYSDVSDFLNTFRLLGSNYPQVIVDGPDPGITGDEVEAVIDTEWAGVAARNATTYLVVSASTESTSGIDLSALYIIDNNFAPIMSVSYGECEQFLGVGGNAFYYATREQGAAQGITIITASGDSGSAGCDQSSKEVAAQYGLTVNGLASTPFNVAVGGTDFADVNAWSQYWNSTNSSQGYLSALSYIPETTWNNTCAASGQASSCASAATDTPIGIDHVGGGGGPSTCGLWNGTGSSATCASGYPKPAWQTGAGVPQDGVRDIPDISLFASANSNSKSFYALCEADALPAGEVSCYPGSTSWYFVGGGGTSFGAPIFAGIMALVNQKYGRQGNANYVLYPLAAQPGAACTSNAAAVSSSNCVFYDVVTGNNSVACGAGSKNCSNQTNTGFGILVDPSNSSTPAWTTTAGYDLATGLGSVNVANLVNQWNSVSFSPTTTTLSSFPATVTHGQPVSFTVNVASGSGTPTGDVSLIAQTSTTQSVGIGSLTLGSGGAFTGTTNMLPGGTYNIVAHYAGDGVHGASDSAPQSITVGKESSQTKVGVVSCEYSSGACTSGTTEFIYGSSFDMLRMDVTNASGQPCSSSTTGLLIYPCPTGTVTGTVQSSFANYTLNSLGYAESQSGQLPAGSYALTANYAGDNNYNSSVSSSASITVDKAATTITGCTFPSTIYAGVFVNCSVTVNTQSHWAAPSNIVQFLAGSALSTTIFNINGTNGSPTTYASTNESLYVAFPAGSYNVVQQYPGEADYLSSATAPVAVNALDFSISANPATVTIPTPGESGTSTLTLTPLYGFSGTVSLAVLSLSPTGAACTVSPTSVTLAGSSPATATLSISTTGTSIAPPTTSRWKFPPFTRPLLGWPWLLVGLGALAVWSYLTWIRRRAAWWGFATAVLLLAIVVACGGGGGGGTYIPTAPSLSYSPPSLTFASQTAGTTSGTQSVLLQNTGNASLTISGISIGGTNPGDFSQTSSCSSGVAPGGNCNIGVTFTPTAAGARSASLLISDNATGSPQSISLTGTGVSPQPTPPGTYYISVSAMSNGIQHSTPITLTVQ